ncbi:MAG TPA: hypothetical protein VFB21_24760 [Chthonomonadaceae bacterium]|nr:hypothetical protein [Chthonomonadaceae bacterium]
MRWHQAQTEDRRDADAEGDKAFARRTGLRGRLGLRMLPDSFSHLHYLHHVFHHHGVCVTRSVPAA